MLSQGADEVQQPTQGGEPRGQPLPRGLDPQGGDPGAAGDLADDPGSAVTVQPAALS